MSSCPFNLHGGLAVNLVSVYNEYQQPAAPAAEVNENSNTSDEERGRYKEQGMLRLGMMMMVPALLYCFWGLSENRFCSLYTLYHPRTYHVLLSVNTPAPPSSNRVQFNSIHGPTDGQSSGCGFSPTCRIFTFVGPTFNLQGCTGRNCGYIYYSS